jgi:hypothetical protein
VGLHSALRLTFGFRGWGRPRWLRFRRRGSWAWRWRPGGHGVCRGLSPACQGSAPGCLIASLLRRGSARHDVSPRRHGTGPSRCPRYVAGQGTRWKAPPPEQPRPGRRSCQHSAPAMVAGGAPAAPHAPVRRQGARAGDYGRR